MKNLFRGLSIAVCVSLFSFMAIASGSSDDTGSTTQIVIERNGAETQEESSDEATVEETESVVEYEITDTSFNYYTNSIGTVEYHGIVEITNTGNTPLYLDNCTFDLEDNDGHLLQSDSLISKCPDVIFPGEVGYFYNSFGSIDGSISIDNGVNLVPSISIEAARNGASEIIEYEVSDTSIREGDFGYIAVTGRVTNNTSEDESYLYINIVFYDENGDVLSIDGTSVTNLNAGSTVSFDCSCYFMDDDVSIDQVADYQVIARSYYMQW